MSKKLRVCVIGAGPGGLCALRYLKADSDKFEAVAYERNLWPGGVWAYTDRTENDETGNPVHSAMYYNLRINLPKELQEFPGFPYPKHWKSYITRQQCLEYINNFIDFFKLRPLIKTHTIVRNVEHLTGSENEGTTWKVTISDSRKIGDIRTEMFDSVLVCSGRGVQVFINGVGMKSGWTKTINRYSKVMKPRAYKTRKNDKPNIEVKQISSTHRTKVNPFRGSEIRCPGKHWNEYIPDIVGRDDFQGVILHSKNYRHAELFEDLDVAILGGFRTAEDIGLQVAEKARKVYVCHRCQTFPVSFPKEIEQRPPFVRMTKKGVVFTDGSELHVDAVIFCTGYRYSFPFLEDDIISIRENRITPLYKHLVHIKYPSLIFLSVPQHLAYFPFLNQFAKFAVRVIDGRIQLPSKQEMLRESDEDYQSRIREGMKPKYAHYIGGRMWNLDKEISTLGQFECLPPVMAKLRDDIVDERNINIVHAYDFDYEITGHDSYRIINPSGSKSRSSYSNE